MDRGGRWRNEERGATKEERAEGGWEEKEEDGCERGVVCLQDSDGLGCVRLFLTKLIK